MEKISKEEFDIVLSKNCMIFDDDFYFDSHMLWHGHENANKKNLLRYFIAKNYKQDYLKMEKHIFPISNNHDTFNITMYKSMYHWELDFSWTGNNTNNGINKNSNDQYVIDYFVNNFCKTFNINIDNYKILVLFNTHRLTLNNQKMILRIMENAFQNVKFIIITDAVNRIDYTIKSRCLNLRIPYTFYSFDKNNNKYIYNVSIDKKTQYFYFYKILYSDENIEEYTMINEINNLKVNKWNGNSIQSTLDRIFNNLFLLKQTIHTSDSHTFQNNYNKIIEEIDSYLLACNTIQDFIFEFISFLIKVNNLNLSKYIEYFAKMESMSLKCDYQVYILESIITFFLLN